jgi:hypothetical protein
MKSGNFFGEVKRRNTSLRGDPCLAGLVKKMGFAE